MINLLTNYDDFIFYSAIASALAKQEAILSQLHEDLNMHTDNTQVRYLFYGWICLNKVEARWSSG